MSKLICKSVGLEGECEAEGTYAGSLRDELNLNRKGFIL